MILPRGITGFRDRRAGGAIPAVAPKSFARACHTAARLGGGRVETFDVARYPRNYYRAIIRLREDAVAVLCNAHFPWVAFASVSDDGISHRFIDAPALASRFYEAMPCEVLSPSSLEGPPDAASLNELSAAELEQIRYWEPDRLGDIIFNSWD